MIAARAVGRAARGVFRSTLGAYAQVLFSSSPLPGALLLLATMVRPEVGLWGLLAVLSATAAARLFDLDGDAIASGSLQYNALLAGLGVAATLPPQLVPFATVVSAAVSVLLSASLRAWLGAAQLPFLSLPFLVVFAPVLALAAPALALGVHLSAGTPEPAALAALVPPALAPAVRAFGGLFFLPRLDAGLCVWAALLVHSRIAAGLAALACAALPLLDDALGGAAASVGPALPLNAALVAIALGGVWFVPSASSLALAAVGALSCTWLALGVFAPLSRLGLPLLVLPFNATVLLLLLAARQRTTGQRPRAVDFLARSPEQARLHARARLDRFGLLHAVAIHLPFRGRWVCTQSDDVRGPKHRGPWRHAFDFEVAGPDGALFAQIGAAREDYHCFRLPVLACAAGTVVKVVADVPDNAVGAMNLAQNWGNLVLLQHAPRLYSLVAHLAQGTVRVREGQVVARGEVLGHAGSSGRAPTPHLHFQLQESHLLGAPTLPCAFSDVVRAQEGRAVLAPAHAPTAGEIVRGLEGGDALAPFFAFGYGETWCFEGPAGVEHVEVDVDLYGQRLLRSRETGAMLVFAEGEASFSAYDVTGPARSVLHLLRAALPRAPRDGDERLVWRDGLWSGLGGRARLGALGAGPMTYRLAPEGGALVVKGESAARRAGQPIAPTRVVLTRGGGPLEICVTLGAHRLAATRAALEAAPCASQRAQRAEHEPSVRSTRSPSPICGFSGSGSGSGSGSRRSQPGQSPV